MNSVRKFVSGAVIADTTLNERQIRVVASDATIDRAKDILLPKGCVLADYTKNNIVLADHDSKTAIGNADLVVTPDQVAGVVTFAPAGISPKADEYCGLYKAGVLKAVSVGFDPIEWEPIKGGGIRYTKWALMELSCVAVPCNPNAVTIERSVEASNKSDKTDWKVGASRNLSIDDGASWDGDAAKDAIFEHADFAGDKPDSTFARKGFLAYDAANPAEKGSYKLPFATVKDGRLVAVASGLRAAASRLEGTDIPDDVKKKARAVIDHYEAKMKDGDGKSGSAKTKQMPLGKNGKPKIKGLYECAELAQVLAHLGWIHDSSAWEAEVEQDASKLPAVLAGILTDVAGALVAMTQEETSELLAGHGIEVLPPDADYIEAATTPQAKALRTAFRKAGRVLSQANAEHIAEIHKCLGKMADCYTKAADLHDDVHQTLEEWMGHGTSAGEHVKAILKSASSDDSDDEEDDSKKKPNGGDAEDDDGNDADNELAAAVEHRKRLVDVMERQAP